MANSMNRVRSQASYMELYNAVETAERMWKQSRAEDRKRKAATEAENWVEGDQGGGGPGKKEEKRSQAKYESQYWEWVKANFGDKFQSFSQFDACKRFRNSMAQA
eukprot:4153567-Alexandrium_andersonii.AAC.1